MFLLYFWSALFALAVLLLVSWRVYRDKVPSWQHLLGTGLSVVMDNYGWTVEYRRFDERVPFWERIFIRMDLGRILESRPEVRHRFFKDGKVLPMTPELETRIEDYQSRRRLSYHNTEGRPWRSNLLAARQAPYDACEVSFSKSPLTVPMLVA